MRLKKTKMMMTMTMKKIATLMRTRSSWQKMRTRRTKPQNKVQAAEAAALAAQKMMMMIQVLVKKMARTESTLETCSMLRLLSSWLAQWNLQVCTMPKQGLTTSAPSQSGALVANECATPVWRTRPWECLLLQGICSSVLATTLRESFTLESSMA